VLIDTNADTVSTTHSRWGQRARWRNRRGRYGQCHTHWTRQYR
jgi:hypothetical protein